MAVAGGEAGVGEQPVVVPAFDVIEVRIGDAGQRPRTASGADTAPFDACRHHAM
jgi:hypothetical protein